MKINISPVRISRFSLPLIITSFTLLISLASVFSNPVKAYIPECEPGQSKTDSGKCWNSDYWAKKYKCSSNGRWVLDGETKCPNRPAPTPVDPIDDRDETPPGGKPEDNRECSSGETRTRQSLIQCSGGGSANATYKRTCGSDGKWRSWIIESSGCTNVSTECSAGDVRTRNRVCPNGTNGEWVEVQQCSNGRYRDTWENDKYTCRDIGFSQEDPYVGRRCDFSELRSLDLVCNSKPSAKRTMKYYYCGADQYMVVDSGNDSCGDLASESIVRNTIYNILRSAGYSPEAISYLLSLEYYILNSGGGHYDATSNEVTLGVDMFGHIPPESVIHETSHAWYKKYVTDVSDFNFKKDLVTEVLNVAKMNPNEFPQYAPAIALAKEFVVGNENWGGMFPGINDPISNVQNLNLLDPDLYVTTYGAFDWVINDAEIHGGFASASMGNLDFFPPNLRVLYSDMFSQDRVAYTVGYGVVPKTYVDSTVEELDNIDLELIGSDTDENTNVFVTPVAEVLPIYNLDASFPIPNDTAANRGFVWLNHQPVLHSNSERSDQNADVPKVFKTFSQKYPNGYTDYITDSDPLTVTTTRGGISTNSLVLGASDNSNTPDLGKPALLAGLYGGSIGEGYIKGWVCNISGEEIPTMYLYSSNFEGSDSCFLIGTDKYCKVSNIKVTNYQNISLDKCGGKSKVFYAPIPLPLRDGLSHDTRVVVVTSQGAMPLSVSATAKTIVTIPGGGDYGYNNDESRYDLNRDSKLNMLDVRSALNLLFTNNE